MPAFDRGTSRFVSSLTIILLTVGWATSTEDQVRADPDYQSLATSAASFGMMQVVEGSNNIAGSSADCACKANGGCAPAPWSSCAMLGMNVLSLAPMVMSLMSNTNAGSSVSAGAGLAGISPTLPTGIDPTVPLLDQLPGCANGACAAACAGGAGPLCDPSALGSLPSAIAGLNAGLANGTITPPDGMSAQDAIAQNANALGQLNTALGGALGADAGYADVTGQKLSDTLAGAGGHGTAQASYGDDGDGSGGGAIAGLDSLSKNRVGPTDRSGLGKTSWNGLLDMVDDSDGKSLTIWQRTTRRIQGNNGLRAYMLARAESIRGQALKLAAGPKANLKVAAGTKTAPSRKLATLGKAAPLQRPARH